MLYVVGLSRRRNVYSVICNQTANSYSKNPWSSESNEESVLWGIKTHVTWGRNEQAKSLFVEHGLHLQFDIISGFGMYKNGVLFPRNRFLLLLIIGKNTLNQNWTSRICGKYGNMMKRWGYSIVMSSEGCGGYIKLVCLHGLLVYIVVSVVYKETEFEAAIWADADIPVQQIERWPWQTFGWRWANPWTWRHWKVQYSLNFYSFLCFVTTRNNIRGNDSLTLCSGFKSFKPE